MLKFYEHRSSEDELEQVTITYACELLKNKIKCYNTHPFIGDEILKNFDTQYK